MISVSNDFKSAIKSDNREIYGYVEVNYQNNKYNLDVVDTPTLASLVLSDGSGLVSNKKTMKKYATLENNYTLLDGSFMVCNENVIDDAGIITDDVFEDIDDATITINNDSSEVPIKGITIYFKDNLPFDFDITFTYSDETVSTDNIRNNTSMIYQKIFTDDVYISSIEFTIINVEHSDNRLRISCVDFNLSDLYEGDELVDFEITEEIDLLLESVPTNTCTINLNNYPTQNGGNKFDPINPTGIVKYLNDNVIIKPFIGVLTENNGIEYVSMGIFYLKDWSSNPDGNVVFNGDNIIWKISNLSIVPDGNFLRNYFNGEQVSQKLNTMTGFNFDLTYSPRFYDNENLKKTDLLGYLQSNISTLIFSNISNDIKIRKFYTTRDNIVKLAYITNTPVDKISRNNITTDVDYKIKSIINTLEVKDLSPNQTLVSTGTETVVSDEYTLTSEEDYIWYTLNKFTNYSTSSFSYQVVSGSATATVVDKNYWLLYVKVTGTVGSKIKITYTGSVFPTPSVRNLIFKNNILDGETLSLDYNDYGISSDMDWLKEYYLNYNKKYKISLTSMGNPSIEVGDVVSVQTRYNDINDGYKDIIITKQRFTFDGGLQCDIEGEGD